MIQYEFHAGQLHQSLRLDRFSFHENELVRALKPILDEVYRNGYDQGVADQINHLTHDEIHIPVVKPEVIDSLREVTAEEMKEIEVDTTYEGAETVG